MPSTISSTWFPVRPRTNGDPPPWFVFCTKTPVTPVSVSGVERRARRESSSLSSDDTDSGHVERPPLVSLRGHGDRLVDADEQGLEHEVDRLAAGRRLDLDAPVPRQRSPAAGAAPAGTSGSEKVPSRAARAPGGGSPRARGRPRRGGRPSSASRTVPRTSAAPAGPARRKATRSAGGAPTRIDEAMIRAIVLAGGPSTAGRQAARAAPGRWFGARRPRRGLPPPPTCGRSSCVRCARDLAARPPPGGSATLRTGDAPVVPRAPHGPADRCAPRPSGGRRAGALLKRASRERTRPKRGAAGPVEPPHAFRKGRWRISSR